MIFSELKIIYYLKTRQAGIKSLESGNFINPTGSRSISNSGIEGALTTIINRINSYQWK